MSDLTQPVTSQDRIAGSARAPVTLVEYGDYQCPSCGQAYPIVKRLQKHFGDELRFVFRNFPLPMHPHAEHAAEAAEFAAAHGKFWEMHDALFKHQADLRDAELLKLAEQQHLSADDLKQALADGTYARRVRADMESGESSGVPGTPTFFINGEEYEDSYDYASLVDAIKSHTK